MLGIGIRQAHDALAITDEFTNPPNVEARIVAPDGVDRDQVVTKRVGAGQVEIRERAGIAEALEIEGVALAFGILGQQVELSYFAQRQQITIGLEPTDIERSNMTRETVECMMRPDQCVSAISHVFVAEGPRTHRVQYSAAMPAVGGLIVDADRSSVPVTFSNRFIGRLAQICQAEEYNILAQQRPEIALHLSAVQTGDYQLTCHVGD